METPTLGHDDYTVAWICPLEIEQIAAMEMLDEEHPRLSQPSQDHNAYALGSIQGHNIVIAGLPEAGNASAATVVAQMLNTFRRLRFGLLVGIGGGVPVKTDEGYIRLGHVVVSKPTGQHSGAVQYDHGKAEAGEFRRYGCLALPPKVLLNAAQRLGVKRRRARKDPLEDHLRRIDTSRRGLKMYRYPGASEDYLYEATYIHLDREKSCQGCGCDPERRVTRQSHEDSEDEENEGGATPVIKVHRGNIAVGEKVMRNGLERDLLAKESQLLCFEMEAAGALSDFSCLVIRGISDYADSHKSDKWQGYAAAVAAAYARELFFHMPLDEVEHCQISYPVAQQLISSNNALVQHNLAKDIQTWLAPPDVSTNHSQARQQNHSETGQWLVQLEQYVQWKTRKINTLWLHGIPGCGKTILTSTIIEDFRASNHLLAYFYFDFRDIRKQTFENMLRALLFQFYHHDSTCQSHLEHIYGQNKNKHEPLPAQSLVPTLTTLMTMVEATIVLDALDECTTAKDLLSWLASLPQQNVGVLFTSRTEQQIEASLSAWVPPDNVIQLSQAPVNDDIRTVVRARLTEDSELQRWRDHPEIRTHIEDSLMNKADGMFRWAVCQLDALQECIDLRSLEDALTSLPRTLNDTYARILDNIPEERRPSAIRLLQFLAYGRRPLRLKEAIDAIAVYPDQTPAFEERYRMPRPQEITRYCSSLVRVLPRDDMPEISEGQERDHYLQLSHLSVKEYLVSGQTADPFRTGLLKHKAEAVIVSVSLAYMSTTAALAGAQPTSKHTDLLKIRNEVRAHVLSTATRFPLLRYAATFWIDHAPSVDTEDDALVWVNRFFDTASTFDFWLSIFNVGWNGSWRDRDNFLEENPQYVAENHVYHDLMRLMESGSPGTPIYYSCLGGLTKPTEHLLNQHADPLHHGGRCGNALQAAAKGGHQEVVGLLLPSIMSNENRDALRNDVLWTASDEGREGVVRLLLDAGADCTAYGGLIIAAALKKGRYQMVNLLLTKCIDARIPATKLDIEQLATSEQGRREIVKVIVEASTGIMVSADEAFLTASSKGLDLIVDLSQVAKARVNVSQPAFLETLSTVIENKDRETLELLLDGSERFGLQDHAYRQALLAISGCHDQEMARLLLHKWPNAHSYQKSALSFALRHNQPNLTKFLLSSGANDNSHRSSALRIALKRRNHPIAKLLLEAGTRMEGDGNFALCDAAERGDQEMAKLLLNAGVSVNVQIPDSRGHALQIACFSGEIGLVKLLLDAGADMDAQGGHCHTALQAASRPGQVDVVQLLLEYGADVNTQGGRHGNALQAATYRGSVAVVKLLLEHGADINAQGGSYGNALQAAVSQGHLAVAELLLDQGADINAQGGFHGTALQAAACQGSLDVVKLLLDHGADANVYGGKYGSALRAAALHGNRMVEKMLLDHGADANAQGSSRGGAFQDSLCEDNPEVADLMIDHGADFSDPEGFYNSPFYAAVNESLYNVVEPLPRRGAIISARRNPISWEDWQRREG